MAVYIKYDRFTVGHGMIFDFGTEDGTYTDEDGNSVSADSVMLYDIAGDDSWDNSRIAFQIDGGPGEGYKYTSEGNFEELTWTHIVLTVKDNTMRTYKNGVKVDENLGEVYSIQCEAMKSIYPQLITTAPFRRMGTQKRQPKAERHRHLEWRSKPRLLLRRYHRIHANVVRRGTHPV